MERRIETRELVHILVLFLIVQFGGMLLTSLLIGGGQVYVITGGQGPVINTVPDVLFYVVYLLVATAIMLLLIKFYSGELIFRLLEAFVIISASFFVFLVVLIYILPANVSQSTVYFIALLFSVALVVAKNKEPRLRNFAAVIASVGVGVVLGVSFSFVDAFLLLVIIAVYDYISVFITKHMLVLGEAVSRMNLAFMVGATDVEVVSPHYYESSDAQFKQYKKEIKKVKNPVIQKIVSEGDVPLVAQVQLGAGDLGLPLMLAVSAYSTFINYFTSFVIVLGSAFGIVATMYIFKRYRQGLPAIPPLLAFISIFLGIKFLLVPPMSILLAVGMLVVGLLSIGAILLRVREK